MALLTDIATYLQTALSLATVYTGQMPDTPDACVTVHEYGGFAPVNTMGTDHQIRRPRIQIACRGAQGDYATPRATADSAYTALHMGGAVLSGTTYYRVEAVDEPFPLERDANNRWIIVANYQVWKA